eukprot:m.236242 g.236242  ORF g.236242 m.236242 type:complete len:60 (+) comp40131_c0_seq29:3565-3744(+)
MKMSFRTCRKEKCWNFSVNYFSDSVSVMRKCWRYQILDRPSYTDILKELPALEGYEAVV